MMSNPSPNTSPNTEIEEVLVHKPGRMSRRTSRLAFGLTLPGILMVLGVVFFPLLTTFWISFKNIELKDLRAPKPQVSERIRGDLEAAGDEAVYRFSLSLPKNPGATFNGLGFSDVWPKEIQALEIDPRCQIDGGLIDCELGHINLDDRYSEKINIPIRALVGFDAEIFDPKGSDIQVRGSATNPLIAKPFTGENYRKAASTRNFWGILLTTFSYTFFSTIGAILVGLFAALLLNQPFRGRSIFRGFLLFPYVAPVIAVALTWITLLDPTSGTLNALLVQMQALETPFNFFGKTSQEFTIFGWQMGFPVALTSVIVFEVWRYFPLAFLFILARMQSIPQDMYEAATMDGASPIQQFFALSMPMLIGLMSTLFMLRFIWTFNKFEDIYLLTGGGSGTRTLTLEVERYFSVENFGAASAIAVVIFLILSGLAILYFRTTPKDEGL